jgi:hypothetical protein
MMRVWSHCSGLSPRRRSATGRSRWPAAGPRRRRRPLRRPSCWRRRGPRRSPPRSAAPRTRRSGRRGSPARACTASSSRGRSTLSGLAGPSSTASHGTPPAWRTWAGPAARRPSCTAPDSSSAPRAAPGVSWAAAALVETAEQGRGTAWPAEAEATTAGELSGRGLRRGWRRGSTWRWRAGAGRRR